MNKVLSQPLSFPRVGNSHFGFLIKLLVFCDQKSKIGNQIAHCCSFVMSDGSNSLMVALLYRAMRANCSRCSLKKSDGAKSNGSNSLLGIKKGKNCQKLTKNTKNLSFWEGFVQITRESLTSLCFLKSSWLLFCKERRERLAHGCSFLRCESLTVPL